jgi:hypothetical protein
MPRLTRRGFLKLAALSSGALLAPPFPPDEETPFSQPLQGRVTTTQVSVFSLPRDDARIVKQLFRDRVFPIYDTQTPPTGPSWNPVWYRVWGGYVHSAHVQLVQTRFNPAVSLPAGGTLGEITVPYANSMRYSSAAGWTPLYRLYYQTTHWITGLTEGPDRSPWYEITDELGDTRFFVPASGVRLLPEDELSPISPDLPFEAKRVEVELARQTITAYENGEVVFHTKVSTGIQSNATTNGIPTNTPAGTFNISVKMPSKHMGEGRLTDNLEDYELVGVPWTAFFDPRGYAIHGAYWHNNFGVPMSRGCINLKPDEAKWLFRWLTPVSEAHAVDTRGFGTRLEIF